jgi:CRISPR-associated protein Cas1
MTDRIIDLSEGAARLSVRYEQLVIERESEPLTVPLADLAVLIVAHPMVSYTHAVLTRLCSAGGIFILCNEKRLPVGMLLPLEGHFVQTERFADQAEAPIPIKKQLWKQIIRAKVKAQGKLLQALHGKDRGLTEIAKKVRSGDTENLEAQASRRYWPMLFGEDFQRDFEAEDQNRLLNYGYAVLRAIVARAICAAGLHPSLGLHHHNRYNPFCLADDLMEPFRPLVDGVVAVIVKEKGEQAPLDKETKAEIIGSLTNRRFTVEDESRTLFDILSRVASSLAAVYAGKRKSLILPEL